jgi:hypothetical protein
LLKSNSPSTELEGGKKEENLVSESRRGDELMISKGVLIIEGEEKLVGFIGESITLCLWGDFFAVFSIFNGIINGSATFTFTNSILSKNNPMEISICVGEETKTDGINSGV